jgi:hypothetical protein
MSQPRNEWGPDDEEMAVLQRFANRTAELTGRGTPHLNKALAAAQAEFTTFAVEDQRTVVVEHKDGGSHSYKYITLGKVIEVTAPILAKHGLSFRSMPGYGDPGDGKIGQVLRYTLAHESGEQIDGVFPLSSGDKGIQGYGSAITYARRYILAAMLNLAVEQDDDGMAADLANGVEPAGVKAQPSGGRARKAPPARSNRAATPAAADALPMTVPTAMKNHMFGLLGKVVPKQADAGADRDVRLGWVSGAIGRVVASSNDLTRDEVQRVIDLAQEEIDGRNDTALTEGTDPDAG